MRVPSASICVVSLTSTAEYGAPFTVLPIMLPCRPITLICGTIFSNTAACSSCAIPPAANIDPAASAAYKLFIVFLLIRIVNQTVRARAAVGRDDHVGLHIVRSDRRPDHQARVDRLVVERHEGRELRLLSRHRRRGRLGLPAH